MENKEKFLNAIGEALKAFSREQVQNIKYIEEQRIAQNGTPYTKEVAVVTYTNGYQRVINVHGSSCAGMLIDIGSAFM